MSRVVRSEGANTVRRIIFLLAGLVGLVAVGAACQPFGTPDTGDYVVFRTCAQAPCTAGNENILLMRSPATSTDDGVTTMTGNIELRLLGRDDVYHNYSFPHSTIVENTTHPDLSSIEVGTESGELVDSGSGPGYAWTDAFGVTGLGLTDVTLDAHQGATGDWVVGLDAKPAYALGSPAENLVPGHAATVLMPTIPNTDIPLSPVLDLLANQLSVSLSDLGLPITVVSDVPMSLVPASVGFTADGATLTKVSRSDGHSDLSATVDHAAVAIGATQVSNLDIALDVTDELTGSLHATGTVVSSDRTWNVGVDFPFGVTFPNGTIQARIGPGASITATSATTNISFEGAVTATLNTSGAGQSTFSLTDGTIHYDDVTVEGLDIEVATGGATGLAIDLHAATAQLTPSLTLTDVDLGWHGNVLDVAGTAQLTGTQAHGTVHVSGTATISGGTPSLILTVSVPELTFALADGANASQRTLALKGATFALAVTGDLDSRTVTLNNASLDVDDGTYGDLTFSGSLAVNAAVTLGPNLEIQGWSAHLDANVKIGAYAATAVITGSGGVVPAAPGSTVPPVTGPPVSAVAPFQARGVAVGGSTLPTDPGSASPGSVEAVITLTNTGNGLGGVLRATVYRDTSGALHLDGTGNAHLTLGSKVTVDGAVAIHDTMITLDARIRLGTSIAVPVSGTITINPGNLTAIPTVDITVGQVHISDKLAIDNVHLTNAGSLTTFTIDGSITNDYAVKALGITVFDLGDLTVNGTVDLASGDLTSATAGTIGYDFGVTAPAAYTSPRILSVFYVAKSGLNFHVWGDTHVGHLSLEAQAAFGANVVIATGTADMHLSMGGTANFDTGAVSITGVAGARVFGQAFGIAEIQGVASVNVSLTGNLNGSLQLVGSGSGTATGTFIGIPVAGGDIHLGGNVNLNMASGAVSGTAYANWSIDVVGGLFGNHDGDWKYNVAGTVANPVVTAHDSSWRDNHDRAIDIAGPVYPVKNVCGLAQHKGTLQTKWHDDGQWGQCLATGYYHGTGLVDTDGSHSATSADQPLGAPMSVEVTDSSAGNALVGSGVVEANGALTVAVVVNPGHTYKVTPLAPSGYVFAPPSKGYATSGSTFAAPGGGAWVNVGTFGITERAYAGLTGLVFADVNHNGVQDTGEAGLADLVVTVNGRRAITAWDGRWDLGPIEVGTTANVSVQAPTGWTVTGDPDATRDGATSVTVGGGTTTVGAFGLCHGSASSCTTVVGPPLGGGTVAVR